MDLPPMQGRWGYKESRIWVNDQEITSPVWTATHREESNGIPPRSENCVGCRPAPIHLEKGWGKMLTKLPVDTFNIPKVHLVKRMFASACVTPNGERAVEGLVYSPDKRFK